MTWCKTGSQFPHEAFNVQLSDAAYRTHHEATSYLFEIERTDCLIRTDEVRRFAGSPHADMAVTELVGIDWWRIVGQGYEVVKGGDDIRSGIVTQQKKRATSKATSQSYRARKSAETGDGDTSRDASRNQSIKQAVTAEPQERAEAEAWPPVAGVAS